MLYLHFKALASTPELRHLILQGVCIGKRKIEGFQVLLFQTRDVYYEVVLDKRSPTVLTFWTFNSVDDLEPYLKEIMLPEFV